ncbi:NAD-dependent deacylase [Ectothiorhodospiraceae bacterium WFHF3C12]|nr:NAD-dependent deacylase [Ectothiorhodospiraceae bacterium WFHF3C12]
MIPQDFIRSALAARHVVVLTGAGISAESGVPTFRDAQTGLWARYDPQDLATPEAFERDPGLVWSWYEWRRELIAGARPNAAHQALARWQRQRDGVRIVTQNVDGLHARAGSREVIELHGNITRTLCSRERREVADWAAPAAGAAPTCPACGAYLRPDVVWFGESLPMAALEAAVQAVRGADLVLSVGTSSLVQPAASLPYEALGNGVPVAEINPEATSLSERVSFSLRGRAGEVLPELVNYLESG